ncbi:Endothiapepsin [Cytospora mali]|uniref:Endothiapepsin n=1 Tax=Cytospora mali TaxID=578113 RepID=A0A194VKS5_CYTMA|nr:Endothiapepsin [Valsa mali]
MPSLVAALLLSGAFAEEGLDHQHSNTTNSLEVTSAEVTSAEATSAELTSAEPTSAEPTSVETTSMNSTSSEANSLETNSPEANSTDADGVGKLNVDKFSVKQVRNEYYKKKSGLVALLDAYAKYSAPLPDQLKIAMKFNGLSENGKEKRQHQTGSTTATPPQGYDYEFLCPVDIGTPAQTMNLNFDSGSSDLWVFSNDTTAAEINGQEIYNASNSTTAALKPGYTFSIGYGDGNTASGIVYTDVVSIGGASVRGMAVESALEVSSGFTSDPYSWGLLGLGMSAGNTVQPVKQLTFMDTIKSSLQQQVFTANLKHGIPGEYDFGYIDSTQYTGRIQYGSIAPSSIYWEFAATGYRIGAAPNASAPNAGYTTYAWRSIADTGTTLLLVPDQVVTDYYAAVDGSAYDDYWGGVLFPCAVMDDPGLPDFTFGIGLYKGTLPGRYINYGNVNDTYCYGGIQTQGSMEFGIFGDVIMKAQFVVFDLGNQRIGFAQKDVAT